MEFSGLGTRVIASINYYSLFVVALIRQKMSTCFLFFLFPDYALFLDAFACDLKARVSFLPRQAEGLFLLAVQFAEEATMDVALWRLP